MTATLLLWSLALGCFSLSFAWFVVLLKRAAMDAICAALNSVAGSIR